MRERRAARRGSERDAACVRPIPAFDRAVYRVVRRIPRGRLLTYGQVAALAGRPRAARAVGRALRELSRRRVRDVPWHRVVNAAGRISQRDLFGPEIQRERLEEEGIALDGRGRLDRARLTWAVPRRRAP